MLGSWRKVWRRTRQTIPLWMLVIVGVGVALAGCESSPYTNPDEEETWTRGGASPSAEPEWTHEDMQSPDASSTTATRNLGTENEPSSTREEVRDVERGDATRDAEVLDEDEDRAVEQSVDDETRAIEDEMLEDELRDENPGGESTGADGDLEENRSSGGDSGGENATDGTSGSGSESASSGELPSDSRTRLARDLRRVWEATVSYHTYFGEWPSRVEQLVEAKDPRSGVEIPSALEIEPRDPWGRGFRVTIVDDGPVVATFGRDGEPGGSGLDADILYPQLGK